MERLLTAEEVAEVLSVRVGTLHQWRWQGKGPRAIKSGRGFVRYRPADLQAWIKQHADPETPPAA
jgi:predicted DNA-binding transcriptional regulator AlpA